MINKSLILLVLVAFSSCSLLKRVERRVKSKDGSGSWAEGYVCPKIFVEMGSKKEENALDAKFLAQPLVDAANKAGTTPVGWEFTLSKEPLEILKKFMVKGNNVWYFPFRYIVSTPSYNNPYMDNKNIQFNVLNDAGETARIRLNLPYKVTGWYINDDEGAKVINALNSLRSTHSNIVRTAKGGIVTSSSVYSINADLEKAAGGSEQAVKDLITKKEQELKDITAKYEVAKKKSDAVQADILNLDTQLAEKRKVANEAQVEMNTLGASAQTISDAINANKADAVGASKNKAKFTTLAKDALTSVSANIEKLKVEAPNRTVEIDAIEKAVKESKSEDLNNNLKKITPVNN
jgi:hypothetical protein